MKKAYEKFCAAELYTASAMLVSIFALVFVSALARTISRPINWAQDLSLVLFAWMTFVGGDYLLRNTTMISIDMLKRKLPKVVQKYLYLVFNLMILVFLSLLVRYGFELVSATQQRMITTLGIRYTWVTMSVPCGSLLMISSVAINTVTHMRLPAEQWEE